MKRRKFALIFAALAVLMVLTGTLLQAQQQALAGKLIRLHVLANSDDAHDQWLKLRVRDAVVKKADEVLAGAQQPEQALKNALPQLEKVAEQTLRALGSEQTVRVQLGKEVFPTRSYDTFMLPAGIYKSLRVSIGQAQGHNWWCVIFPSICLTASMQELEQAAQTAGLTQSELRLITADSGGYVLKFRLLELLQRLKCAILGE